MPPVHRATVMKIPSNQVPDWMRPNLSPVTDVSPREHVEHALGGRDGGDGGEEIRGLLGFR